MNYNKRMFELGNKRSVIRELFEYGKLRAAQIGKENVFDYSLGNPSVMPPETVKKELINLLNSDNQTLLHGYTSAQGDVEARKKIAEYYNKNFNAGVSCDDIYMTVGAAAALCITFTALLPQGAECITFAPYFPEYSIFVEKAGGKLVVVAPEQNTFQIDIAELAKAINFNTRAVLINSPNNPSGVVYSKEKISAMCDMLMEKQHEYGHPIYLISDEPYRELVYGRVEVPCLLHYYDNAIICYSYSKVLSLPGERIGYILVAPKMQEQRAIYFSICGAGRALGYVCAPSLFQHLVARCQGQRADMSIYERNRNLLYSSLTEYGFTCIKPDGAFYLFIKSPDADAAEFCEKAKKYELLLVPGEDFGCKNYARIAYCVSTEQVIRSLPAFKKLAEEYYNFSK